MIHQGPAAPDFAWCTKCDRPNNCCVCGIPGIMLPGKHEGPAPEFKGIPDYLQPEPDNVNNPPHYTQGTIECIEAIEAALTPEEFQGFCKGNALKYIWRERHKGGAESMRKAVWYLDRLTA